MPKAKELPVSIATFSRQEGQVLRESHWDADCSALLEGLREIIDKKRKPEPLRNLHQKLIEGEARYFELIGPEPEQALELARATLRLLDEQVPFYPRDACLQNCRGYAHKNVAMALREQFPKALAWIDRALALVPDYPAALHDREQVVARLPRARGSSRARVPQRRTASRDR